MCIGRARVGRSSSLRYNSSTILKRDTVVGSHDGLVLTEDSCLLQVKSLIGMGHSEVVLCTKFSPIHECFLAVGCLQGKLSFCQPHL